MPSTIFVPNMTISPSLAKQFDSPKNQIPNITNNGTKNYHNHSFTDMLSIYLPITTDKSRQINGKTTDSTQPLNTIIPLDKAYISPITKADKPTDEPIFMKLATKKKYKPVALKVKPVIGELPDKFRIIRWITGDPLQNLPMLPMNPPPFTPTGRYTQERKDLFDKLNPGFLLPAERALMHYFMMAHQDGFAWETSE